MEKIKTVIDFLIKLGITFLSGIGVILNILWMIICNKPIITIGFIACIIILIIVNKTIKR